MRACLLAVVAVAWVACGNDHGVPGVDAGAPDAAVLPEMAAGTQIVDHAAVVTGITVDGYVAYYDYDADNHGIAHVVPLAGGSATTIASSVGTGKQDVRFEIAGDVVFAWTDRGNQRATLTMWSVATGPIDVGSDVRPGRAAVTADGQFVLFEEPQGSGTAEILAGPLAGGWTTVATANSVANDCWQQTDLQAVGDRLLARFCPEGALNWELHSYAGDGSDDVVLSTSANTAAYGAREVWLDGSGAVWSALPDGTSPVVLDSGAAEFRISDDGSAVAARTTAGAIVATAIDGTGSATTLVDSGAMLLGAVSPDATAVLYATALDGSGSPAPIQPYTNVLVGGSVHQTLVSGTTSCPSCLSESFVAGGSAAMVLDPIDNSPTAQGEGVLRVVDLASGVTLASFGTVVYDAFPLQGSAAAGRFVFLEAAPDTSLATGWAYGVTTRDPIAGAVATFAENAEDFAFDPGLSHVAVSFSAGPLTGIWVAPLQ